MKLQRIADALGLKAETDSQSLERDVLGGYAADLLSCAMAGARPGFLWITLQGHLNIVAVATLNDLAGIVVTEGKPIGADTLRKAADERMPIFSTELTTYEVAGRLWELMAHEAGE